MKIKHVKYLGSYIDYKKVPQTKFAEFAFIGRSNVGKSSLINMITHRKELAKVSKQPGKTQTINYFEVDEQWYLVDLPGYGYAKHSKKLRAKWKKMIEDYLRLSPNLVIAFILLDFNIPPQPIDIEFINWMGSEQIPFAIVFTKMDKTKKGALKDQKQLFNKSLGEYWEPLPTQFFTSSVLKIGNEEIVSFISQYLK